MSFREQFAHPRGLGGHAAGWIMRTRGSNVERNRWVVSMLDLGPADRVLEVGCGPGVAAGVVLATGAELVAVDPSEVMRAMAARHNPAATIIEGDSDHLPDGPFTAAFAVNTMIFWTDIGGTLAALRERLAPGGRIAMAVQPRWQGATDADAVRLAEENRDRLEQAGFTDLRIERLALKPTDCACVFGRVSRP